VVVAFTALFQAIVNARSVSTAPSRFFGIAVACRALQVIQATNGFGT